MKVNEERENSKIQNYLKPKYTYLNGKIQTKELEDSKRPK